MSTEMRRAGRRALEEERSDPVIQRRLRAQLVREIRDFHWRRLPGQASTPSLEDTICKFRSRTTAQDIRDIICHRVNASD